MQITVIGCSGSFAGPDTAASCYLLTAQQQGRTWRVLIDLGSGALGPLQRHLRALTRAGAGSVASPEAGVDLGNGLDAVLLTHLHPDHCIDLLGLYVARKYRPAGVPASRLPVYGPVGTRERIDAAYEGVEPPGTGEVYDYRRVSDQLPIHLGPFRIVPMRVVHPVEAYGFRVEADGAVVALTGDTDSCPALTPLLSGADLVLADAAFVEGRDTISGIHLSARRAAQAAVAAGGVRRLMLTHLPAWNDPEVARAEAAEVWPGEVELAEAGVTYDL